MRFDLEKLNLQSEAGLSLVQQETHRIIENDLPDEASKLWHALTAALPTIADKTLVQHYRVLTQDLAWLLIPVLPEAQRFELLRTAFLRAIETGVNLETAFTRLVYTVPAMVWPEVALQHIHALRENREPIGSRPLGAYLTDFHHSLPDRRPTDMDVLRYMGQDPTVQQLSEEQRALLRQAFHYYIGLAPLTLAEVSQYITLEERAAFAAEPVPPAETPLQPSPIAPPLPPPSTRAQLFAPPPPSTEPTARTPAPPTPTPLPPQPGPRVVPPPLRSAPPAPPPPAVKGPPSFARAAEGKPPANLPVAEPSHNAGQELTPYRREPDPFMPHRPKPVAKLAGNVVDLKRK